MASLLLWERIDPADPIDSNDPAEPNDRIDPADPIDSIDPADPIEAIDPADAMDETEPTDANDLTETPDANELSERYDTSTRRVQPAPAGIIVHQQALPRTGALDIAVAVCHIALPQTDPRTGRIERDLGGEVRRVCGGHQ